VYNFTVIVVTSLKDLSFKDRDRGKFLLCQEKNSLYGVFFELFFIAIFKPDTTGFQKKYFERIQRRNPSCLARDCLEVSLKQRSIQPAQNCSEHRE